MYNIAARRAEKLDAALLKIRRICENQVPTDLTKAILAAMAEGRRD